MPDKGWKAFERRCSRDLGVERIPVTGERNGADAATEKVCLQFKLRKALPKWLWEWLAGIVGTATKDGKIGALVVKIPRMLDDESIVMLRWKDFVELHKSAGQVCMPELS